MTLFGFSKQEVEAILKFADANIADVAEAMALNADELTRKDKDFTNEAQILRNKAKALEDSATEARMSAQRLCTLTSKLGG